MTSITLPYWVFALSLGLPCLMFLCLVGLLLRKIRNPRKNEMATLWLQHMGNTKFKNDLLYSQIDTVFNGLNAIIESERMKVQSLLRSGSPQAIDNTSHLAEAVPAMDGNQASPQDEETSAAQEQFTMLADESADCVQPEPLPAAELSQSEIDLAMRMRSRPEGAPVRKLEAVA